MLIDHHGDTDALLIDASSGQCVTVGMIRERARRMGSTPRCLTFLLTDGTIESAAWFLTLIEANHPVALIDAANAWAVVNDLIERYRPDMVVDPGINHIAELVEGSPESPGKLLEPTIWAASEQSPTPHEDLAVLLTTSGSTGSPKFVRLSAENIRTNAEQIVKALGITAADRGVTTLPLFYSFGMSILTSHAFAGSPVVVTKSSVLEESFWSDLVDNEVTFLPGVPASYSMLKRLGFERRDLPKLRRLIQAGGHLAPELVSFFHEEMEKRDGKFFVMYGQTEASPRIACLPSDRLPEKLGSVGIVLEGGELSICTSDGVEAERGVLGEVFYDGPNVMMGYATSREDLAKGATHGSLLATGDIGYLDDEGFLYLTGRSKRICKLAGSRVSLDEVEALAVAMLGGQEQVAAVDGGDKGASLFVTGIEPESAKELRRKIARRLGVPPKLIGVSYVGAIPLTPNGKFNYAALSRTLESESGSK